MLNYNTTLDSNFGSSVWNWEVESPAVDPASGELLLPTVPVPGSNLATPASGPLIAFNPAINESEIVTGVANASSATFDETDNIAYLTFPENDSVGPLNATTLKWAGPAIPVGNDPVASLWDASTDQVFVANYGSNNLTIIDGATQSISVAGLPVGESPVALTLDSEDQFVYVANSKSLNLSVVNASDDSLLVPVRLSFAATSLAFAPSADRIAVGMPASSQLLILNATSGGTENLVPLGTNVSSILTALNGTEFVVANQTSEYLTVVNATTGSPTLEAVDVDYASQKLAGPLADGDSFSWSNESREISVFNVENPAGAQVSPDLGSEPEAVAFDPSSGTILVADRTDKAVEFLNSTTLRQTRSPLALLGTPEAIVESVSTGTAYVGFDGGVAEIDSATGTVLTTNDSLPGNNSDLLISATTGYLWDQNSLSGLIALSLASLSGALITGIDLGQSNTDGLALDNLTNNLYVVDRSNSSVVAVNASTGIPAGPWISSISGVSAVAYDSADELVYALGTGLFAIDPLSNQIVAGPIALGEGSAFEALTFDSSRDFLYVVDSGVGPTFNGSVEVIDGSSLNASQGSFVTIPVGLQPVAAATVALRGTLTPLSSEIWVANLGSGTLSVIASPPVVTAFGSTPDPVDVGATTQIVVQAEGGAGQTTVIYSGLPPSCATADLLSLSCTPAERGTYNVTVEVVDSFGYSASATTMLSVSPAIRLHLGLSANQVDLGMPLNVSATVAAGSGTGPFSFTWSWGDGKTSRGASQSHTYAATGSYILTLTATDVGGGASSASASVTVDGDPQVSLISSSPTNETDVDVPIQLNASVNAGTTPGTGTWNLTGGILLHGLSVSHKFKTVGIYFANFTYVDASGYTVTKTMSVQVNPALSIKLSTLPSTAPIVVGSSILFNVTISGGTAPYSVFWSFDDGSYASGISTEHSFASPGTYNVSLSVEDAAGVWQNSSDKVTVDANSTGHGLLGGSVIAGVFVGAVVGLALGTLILFLVGRRRRKTPPGAPQPYTTGGSTPPTTEGPSAPPESGAPTEWRED